MQHYACGSKRTSDFYYSLMGPMIRCVHPKDPRDTCPAGAMSDHVSAVLSSRRRGSEGRKRINIDCVHLYLVEKQE